MEYLSDINDNLKTISETGIEYHNLLLRPDLFTGLYASSGEHVSFCKFPYSAIAKISEFGSLAETELNILKNAACGNSLRFRSNSDTLIFKVKLKRRWPVRKLINWSSFGFDVYSVNELGVYQYYTVFAPCDGKDTFAEQIKTRSKNHVIYLPNYNEISELYLGIKNGCILEPFPFKHNEILIFYGNSITQGASASRSGNSFPNIVSRKTDTEIINLSCSSCCRGQLEMADYIGKINASCIVIDYTRNAYSKDYFAKTYDAFYNRLRSWHKDTRIILMTSSNFNHWKNYDEFDEYVRVTYRNASQKGDNVALIEQKSLFKEDEYDICTTDGSHYTDYGMFRVADAVIQAMAGQQNQPPKISKGLFSEYVTSQRIQERENSLLRP